MDNARIAVIAAAASVIAWLAKTIAIGVVGGLDQSPLETPLFLAGLLTSMVAVIAISLARTHDRTLFVRVGAALAALATVFAFVAVLNLAISWIQPPDATWVWSEINLWVTALLVLGMAVLTRRRDAAAATGGSRSSAAISHV